VQTRLAVLLVAVAVGLGALLSTGAPLAAGKRVHVTAGDRAATRAYLEAQLALLRAQIATSAASESAVSALEASLERECPGVMTGAPHETFASVFNESEKKPPRQRGEDNRHNRQFEALQSEVLQAIEVTGLTTVRAAAQTYLAAIRPLRWSEPAQTALTQLSADTLEAELSSSVPPVCADMRTWVSSDYRTLSTSSKAIVRAQAEQQARSRATFKILERSLFSLPSLTSFEGPREKKLAREIAALQKSRLKGEIGSIRRIEHLDVALGLQSQAEVEEFETPRKGSVEIGHGRTLARTRFRVYVEPPASEPGPLGATVCRHPITVYAEPLGGGSGILALGISGSSGQGCLSPNHPATQCEQGVLTIELRTVPAARRVRLTTGAGRRVSSRVAAIPRRLGGPGGIYYQALKGPPPGAITLEELGARGKVLRTITIAHPQKCNALKRERPSRRTRTLAGGTLPGGGTFTIEGTLTTFGKHKSFELEAETSGEASGGGGALEALSAISLGPHGAPAFETQLKTGCEPAEFAILYGVLRHPRDTVMVRAAGTLVPLRRAAIPKRLHAGGELAYIALPGVPEELIVRTPKGKTVLHEDLRKSARDAHEVCEGEAEG